MLLIVFQIFLTSGSLQKHIEFCSKQYSKALKTMQTTYNNLKTKAVELSNKIKTYPFENEYTEMVTKLSSKLQVKTKHKK